MPDAPSEPVKIDVTWDDLDRLVAELADRLSAAPEPDVVLAISRGGLVPAGMLGYRLGWRDMLLAAAAAQAEQGTSPVNLALFNPVQITAEETSVTAFRFSLLYGRNHDVTGLDIGLAAISTGSGVGVQWAGVGLVAGDFTGWQTGLYTSTRGTFQGFQSGVVNHAVGGEGFQWGLVNITEDFSGFQLGFVNYAEKMNGLQIGLVNIIKSKAKLKFFPIVNWRF